MIWKREKPEEEGYYWYLPIGGEEKEACLEKDKAEIVKVRHNFILMPNSMHRFDVNGFNGLWNGPLSAPPLVSVKCLQCGWEGNENEFHMIPVDDEADLIVTNEKACPKCKSVAIESL